MKFDHRDFDDKGKLRVFSPYTLILIHNKSNEILCMDCAKTQTKDTLMNEYEIDFLYEGCPISCDNCNKSIESSYGNPDNDHCNQECDNCTHTED